MSQTHLHESADGRLVEYRRRPSHPAVLLLEARLLGQGGRPHDDSWHPVSDSELQRLDLAATGILEALVTEALDEAVRQRQAEADAASRVEDAGGTEEYPW